MNPCVRTRRQRVAGIVRYYDLHRAMLVEASLQEGILMCESRGALSNTYLGDWVVTGFSRHCADLVSRPAMVVLAALVCGHVHVPLHFD